MLRRLPASRVLHVSPAGARELGAARVLAIDSVPERLATAQRFGAEPINREHQDPVQAVRQERQGGACTGRWQASVGNAGARHLAIATCDQRHAHGRRDCHTWCNSSPHMPGCLLVFLSPASQEL